LVDCSGGRAIAVAFEVTVLPVGAYWLEIVAPATACSVSEEVLESLTFMVEKALFRQALIEDSL
jgi:hypothetical protein